MRAQNFIAAFNTRWVRMQRIGKNKECVGEAAGEHSAAGFAATSPL
jgi:hypothetical protein